MKTAMMVAERMSYSETLAAPNEGGAPKLPALNPTPISVTKRLHIPRSAEPLSAQPRTSPSNGEVEGAARPRVQGAAGRTIFPCARGAKPPTHHGPLQRLLDVGS